MVDATSGRLSGGSGRGRQHMGQTSARIREVPSKSFSVGLKPKRHGNGAPPSNAAEHLCSLHTPNGRGSPKLQSALHHGTIVQVVASAAAHLFGRSDSLVSIGPAQAVSSDFDSWHFH